MLINQLSKTFAVSVLLPGVIFGQAAADSCRKLADLALPNTTITAAEIVLAGAFTPLNTLNTQNRQLLARLPSFCRVAATLKPTSDSDIKIEVWLPESGWNGKFQAVGNGGWSGAISYPGLARALARGYATASTDTGHSGSRASFVLGHPEKLVDFAYRAVHEMTVQGKAITAAYYGNSPRYSYWNGCSSGGKQGLKEAQRFPRDFDGIIAGAPANNWVHQKTGVIAVSQAVHQDSASYIPPEKYPPIHKAVLEACDALDGVKDGILENPLGCQFDPGVLECKGGDSPTCLTAPQVVAARKIYAPVKNPRTGQEIFPGLTRGTELSWAVQAGPEPRTVAVDHYMYVVFRDPKWNYLTLDLDKDTVLADKIDGGMIVASDPHLQPFFGHGGKLLMYHGWADPNIVSTNSVNYFKSVVAATGPDKARDSIRLFMVPGMGHCGGGEGPNNFDMLSALEQWVEHGKTPQQIVASRVENGVVERTRPLCPYPQVAHYKGAGSTDDAANFVCRLP